MDRHVILIGPMCAGKSTVGKHLARLLDLPFVDTDRVVEAHVGPLGPFFESAGEEGFRKIEHRILHEVLNSAPSVIATGGGTPFYFDNAAWIKEHGNAFYLDVDRERLLQRSEKSGKDRPLLFGLNGDALREKVFAILDERERGYRELGVVVDANGEAEAVAKALKRMLERM